MNSVAIRELKPGQSVIMNDGEHQVVSIARRDGEEGRELAMFSGENLRTAVAVEIRLDNGKTYLDHPSAMVRVK